MQCAVNLQPGMVACSKPGLLNPQLYIRYEYLLSGIQEQSRQSDGRAAHHLRAQ